MSIVLVAAVSDWIVVGTRSVENVVKVVAPSVENDELDWTFVVGQLAVVSS